MSDSHVPVTVATLAIAGCVILALRDYGPIEELQYGRVTPAVRATPTVQATAPPPRSSVHQQLERSGTPQPTAKPMAVAQVVRTAASTKTRRAPPWEGHWLGLNANLPSRFHGQRYVRPTDGVPAQAGSVCYGHGVYSPWLHECRCTAGWDGRFCEVRAQRRCNVEEHGGMTNRDSLCAGNCDDDRGHCYCAGLSSPFQRQLPHYCAPWTHKSSRLPDGRPTYPVRDKGGGWVMADRKSVV